jgi:hypothetical protein
MIWGIFLVSKIWILLGLRERTCSPGSRQERTTAHRWMHQQYSLEETTDSDLLRVLNLITWFCLLSFASWNCVGRSPAISKT